MLAVLSRTRVSREAWAALGLAAAALVAVNAPRLALYALAPKGHVFLGAVWGSWDAMVYWETIGDGASGSWLWTDRFDGFPHPAYLIYPPYVLAGQVFRFLPPAQVYEALRWLFEPLALACAWLYVRASLPPGARLWGYLLAIAGGGLGWLFLAKPPTPLGVAVPIDLTDPDFSVLNSFQMAPHLALSAAGLAIYAWGVLEGAAGRRRGLAGALGLGLVASYHEFVTPMALVAGAAFVGWQGRNRTALAVLALSAALALPFDLYLLYLKLYDPLVSRWQTGGSWEIENLPSLLIGRVVLLPFAVLGAVRAVREREPGLALALCWVLAAQLFNALPALESSALHRTLEGSGLAWGVLAAGGIIRVGARVRAYALVLAIITPLLQMPAVAIFARADPASFLDTSQYEAVRWIRANGVQGRVLAAPDTSRLVIGLTALSNDPEGVPIEGRWVLDDLVAEPPQARSDWLRRRGDTVVVWGPAEQARYGAQPPAGLRLLHRDGSVFLLGP